jgi:hypothetical protein
MPRIAVRGRPFLSEQANGNRFCYYKGGLSVSVIRRCGRLIGGLRLRLNPPCELPAKLMPWYLTPAFPCSGRRRARFARRANLPQPAALISPPNHRHLSGHPVPLKRGVSRSSRTLGAGCDGRGSVRCANARGRMMLSRTAKSCGPDAPTLASSSREAGFSGVTVARKPGHRGDHVISR